MAANLCIAVTTTSVVLVSSVVISIIGFAAYV